MLAGASDSRKRIIPHIIPYHHTVHRIIQLLGNISQKHGQGKKSFYNIMSGILRGPGDSMSALVYLLVSTVLNIILDLLFVAQMDMGVNGVALYENQGCEHG